MDDERRHLFSQPFQLAQPLVSTCPMFRLEVFTRGSDSAAWDPWQSDADTL